MKSLLCARKIPNAQLAGRLKTFIENGKFWQTIKKFCCSEGLSNTISWKLSTEKHPKPSQVKFLVKILVKMGIHEMLDKGAIVENPTHLEGQSFLEKKGEEPNSNKIEAPISS